MHLEIVEPPPPCAETPAPSLGTADIATLYRKHRQRAFSIAWAYLKDEEEALDAVQEAFIKAQRNGDRFNGRSSPQTWLYRIVINVCLDIRRRKSRRPELHVEDVDICEPRPCSVDCPEKGVEDLELRAAIFDGLHKLSDNHRVVLVLREFSGLNYEQIAELEGCPKGTVMSRLFHARRQLRQLLGRHLDIPLASVA
jgi:RNA polymerase sigma-70 factor (ECF subfamily)